MQAFEDIFYIGVRFSSNMLSYIRFFVNIENREKRVKGIYASIYMNK